MDSHCALSWTYWWIYIILVQCRALWGLVWSSYYICVCTLRLEVYHVYTVDHTKTPVRTLNWMLNQQGMVLIHCKKRMVVLIWLWSLQLHISASFTEIIKECELSQAHVVQCSQCCQLKLYHTEEGSRAETSMVINVPMLCWTNAQSVNCKHQRMCTQVQPTLILLAAVEKGTAVVEKG